MRIDNSNPPFPPPELPCDHGFAPHEFQYFLEYFQIVMLHNYYLRSNRKMYLLGIFTQMVSDAADSASGKTVVIKGPCIENIKVGEEAVAFFKGFLQN